MATPVQLGVHLADPVDAVVVRVDLPNHLQPLLVRLGSRRGPSGLRGVVAARGDVHPGLTQDGADRLDPEPSTVLVDVVDQHRRAHFSLRSSSAAAKNAEAVRKISFARRNSLFSRSS